MAETRFTKEEQTKLGQIFGSVQLFVKVRQSIIDKVMEALAKAFGVQNLGEVAVKIQGMEETLNRFSGTMEETIHQKMEGLCESIKAAIANDPAFAREFLTTILDNPEVSRSLDERINRVTGQVRAAVRDAKADQVREFLSASPKWGKGKVAPKSWNATFIAAVAETLFGNRSTWEGKIAKRLATMMEEMSVAIRSQLLKKHEAMDVSAAAKHLVSQGINPDNDKVISDFLAGRKEFAGKLKKGEK